MTRLPPAVVLGIDTPIGLAVVRELGEHGVEVHGIARGPRGIGLYSRFLHRGYLRPSAPDELLALLDRIARDSGAPFLLTVGMGDALAMRAAADAGQLPRLKPLLAPLDRLELVNDKAAICRIAAELGIPVPATWEPASADLDRPLPPGLSYPCILKWRDPELAAGPLSAHDLPLLKTEYAHSPAELARVLERYRPAGQFPLVQSYCPGRGLGQMFLMRDGAALLRFQHRRLHEWPPEGGTSTLCESVALDRHPALMAKSEELLRHVGWQGPAMVEYRHDPATDRTALMEINGRFWGSLPLASHAGARFALGTYYALGLERPPPPAPPYRAGLRCRYMIPETRRLLAIMSPARTVQDRTLRFNVPREVLGYLAGFLRPSSRTYVFTVRDPRPFLADMGFILRIGLGQAVDKARRLLRRRAGRAAAGP